MLNVGLAGLIVEFPNVLEVLVEPAGFEMCLYFPFSFAATANSHFLLLFPSLQAGLDVILGLVPTGSNVSCRFLWHFS